MNVFNHLIKQNVSFSNYDQTFKVVENNLRDSSRGNRHPQLSQDMHTRIRARMRRTTGSRKNVEHLV